MRILLPLVLLGILIACNDSNESSGPRENSLLPFQTYEATEQPRGGPCDELIDLAAPLINTGVGYDPENTRRAESILDSTNVAELALNFSYASEGASEMRGAATVTAQAIFFAGGDTVTAT
jgi:hypothetical protein